MIKEKMADKIKKPIPQLQQLRRLSCNQEQPAKGNVSSRAPELQEMQLEKVIGTSSKSTNSLQVNPATGDICYLAGSHLVIYSPRDAKQVKFLPSRTTRPFQCVRFSSDGKYLAAGESAFRLPQITIWEIAYEEIEQIKMIASPAEGPNVSVDSGSPAQALIEEKSKVLSAISYTEIKHLKGHKYGIETVLFSPKNDFLISLGDVNDKGLFVWDWRNETKISQNKLSKPVLLLEISPQQDFFVTGGYQHLKFWYLNEETGQPNARKLNDKSPAILESVSADLTKVKQQIFVGISILGPKVFVLASDGHIYVFDKQRKLLKWMNIKVPRAFGCSAQEGRLYCSCADGTIRVFATDSLQHLLSLSKPPPLGSTNLLAGNGRIKIQQNKSTKFADVIATAIDSVNNRAIALYSDRMMFVWDVAELKSVTVLRSMYSHSGPIHDIQLVPNKFPIGLNAKAIQNQRCDNEESLTKFVTCSSDRTIRFWNMIDPSVQSQKHQEIYQCLAKNAYSKDMSHMIFVTSALRESQDPEDINSDNPKTPYDHFKAGPLDRGEDGQLIDPKDQSMGLLNDKVDSIRCIRISPDGHHLASGDEVGNIRIHDLYSTELSQIKFLESHDCEVISLAYSAAVPVGRQRQPQTQGEDNSVPTPLNRYLLASGGRDKQVLVYDSEQNYEAFMDLHHHSSTITSLQFNEYTTIENSRLSGSPSYQKHLELISSSADRNLISKHLDLARFQIYAKDLDTAAQDTENPLFKLAKTAICKDKILSMDVARQAQFLITGHDKSLCLWKLPMFEKVWEKRVATKERDEEGQQQGTNQVQLRVLIDDYASVIVSSSTSKRVTIYEAATGIPLCRAQPGQITTAMCFSNNMKHLITTSDNGLIFIWRVPEKIAQCLHKVKNEAQRLEVQIERTPSIIEEAEEQEELGDSHGPHTKRVAQADPEAEDLKSEEQAKAEDDQDFDFEVPEKLKITARDNTFIKRRKEQVIDVLADIKKATSFIDGIVDKQSNSIKAHEKSKALQIQKISSDDIGAEEDEDDQATEVQTKNPFKSNRQYNSNDISEEVKDDSNLPGNKNMLSRQQSLVQESQCDANLSDGGSETHEQNPGEVEPNQDQNEREIQWRLDQRKYQQRYANYGQDDDASRMEQIRRSSEMWGRKSISSKLMMRRSSTFVPGLTNFGNAQVNDSVQMDEYNSVVDRMRTQSEQQVQIPMLFHKVNQPNQPQLNSQFASKDPVTDIIDNIDLISGNDIPNPYIRKQNSQNIKFEVQVNPPAGIKSSNPIRIDSGNSVSINDFDASLEKQNNVRPLSRSPKKPETSLSPKKPETSLNNQVKAKQKRTIWGESGTLNQSANADLFKTDKKSEVPFRGFQDGAGKQIDTRPTILDDPNFGLPKSRSAAIDQIQQTRAEQQEKNQPHVERKRSPIKKLVDKMFGTSQDKKKIGMSQVSVIGPPAQQIAEPPKVNIGNFKIDMEYIKEEIKVGRTSPTMKSTPALFQGLRVEQREKTEISPISVAKSNQNVKSLTQRLDLNKNTKEESNEETKFNQSLQAEIDAINASLSRINGLVAQQKLAKSRDTKSLQNSQNTNNLSMELKGLQVAKVHDTVGTKLFESMQNWNSMVKNLQESTDFDIQKVSQASSRSSAYSSQTMLLNFDQSQVDISQAPSMAARSQSQATSSLSQISIKDDARDLLEKYSQLLLESIQAKLQQTTQKPPK